MPIKDINSIFIYFCITTLKLIVCFKKSDLNNLMEKDIE